LTSAIKGKSLLLAAKLLKWSTKKTVYDVVHEMILKK